MTDIYEAIVIDVQQFYIDGFIHVKVKNFNLDIKKDLKDNYDPDFFKNLELNGCLKARVFSPMAGGRNYGMFYLPQVNSRGLVATINDDREDLIWLGSFFDVVKKVVDNKEVKNTVNAPHDDIRLDGYDLITDGNKVAKNLSDQAIVIRTKAIDSSSATSLDWEEAHTKNLIIIDNDRIEINRMNGGYDKEGNLDKYQKIFIGETSAEDKSDSRVVTTIEYHDELKNLHSTFKIEDGNLTAQVKQGETGKEITSNLVSGIFEDQPIFSLNTNDILKGIRTNIRSDGETLLMSSTKEGESSFYKQSNKGIKITTKEANVSISENDILLEGKTVRIAAETLYLGNGAQKLVTTDSDAAGSKTEDGAMLYFRGDKLA